MVLYIKIQVTSSSKTRSHVNIQVRSNVLLGALRINVYACKYLYVYTDGYIMKL
jgi:hypothetical protein